MSTFEIQHFKNQELVKAYMQGIHDIIDWLLKPSEREATNFDRITASPEALAKYIDWAIDEVWDGRCPLIESGKCEVHLKCKDCIADWLKQEAEDDKP